MQLRPSSIQSVSRKRRYASYVLLLVVVAAGLSLYIERQPVHDWLRLRSYTAPSQISSLASEDTMTAYARRLFYLNRPNIDSKSQFAASCPAGTEKTIVLGCYHSNENGIFLLGVNDPRLNGVEQVTAAHEMLHAAYERLSSGDRKEVDALLLSYYEHGLNDKRIIATMAAYKQSEPDQLVNEMHSVFGTEIAHLPASLEAYYKRYFANRTTVTNYAAQYQQVFTSRQAQLKAYDQQLQTLKTEIDAKQASLKSQYAAIQTELNKLQQEKAAGNYEAYNAAVDSYNQQAAAYQQQAAEVRALVAQYNQVVDAHNALVLEEQQLTGELQATPIQTTTKQ